MTTGNEPKTTAEREYPPLPEPQLMARDTYTGEGVRGYEADDMHAYYDLGRDKVKAWMQIADQRAIEVAELKVELGRLRAIAASPAAQAAPAAVVVPAFTRVALGKLQNLLGRGYIINGFSIEKPADGREPDRGFITDGGFVGWWRSDHEAPQPPAQAQEPFGYVNTHTGQFFKDVESSRRNNEGHWRTVYTHPAPQQAVPTSEQAPWDASHIKQPGWNHVQQAFIDGAREARANPDATEHDFGRASDGYTKRVFEEVDPVSEQALRTESWVTSEQAVAPFQQRVQPWMMECFGPVISADREERNHRFLEESLELVQATGCTAHEAHQLVDYVYGRPVGEPTQEVGGVMVTLAALCLANGLDLHDAAEVELARIWTKVETIRAKQAAKPKHSPLPEHAAPASGGAAPGAEGDALDAARYRWLRSTTNYVTSEYGRIDVRNQPEKWDAAIDAARAQAAKEGGAA